ncbi:hypothetical protein BH11MYX4_BH11MYX4_11120 [soil metagenome]
MASRDPGLLERELGPFVLERLVTTPFDDREYQPRYEELAPPGGSLVFAELAVRPFSAAVRAATSPLLPASRAVHAVAKNHAQLVAAGLDSDQVGAVITTSYVDDAALGRAIAASGRKPDPAERFAILVHQLQTKLYVERAERDGIVGESLLDSLGLLSRPKRGLDHDASYAVKAAQAIVAKAFAKRPDLFEAALPGLTATNWYALTMNPSFLGWRFKSNVHAVLVKQLRVAENALWADPANENLSPAELGTKLGVREPHAGGRTKKGSHSMHTLGVAIDVDYFRAPFLLGDHEHVSAASSDRFSETTGRATFLVEGTARKLTVTALDKLGSEVGSTTRRAYAELRRFDETLKTYFGLATDRAALGALMSQRGDPLRQHFGATTVEAVAKIIRDDNEQADAYYRHQRKARDGFLPLPLDLVVAMRDRACLAWGAIDFGRGCGDMMHFDMRATGLGRLLAELNPGRPHVPTSGHPCLAAPVEAPRPRAPTGSGKGGPVDRESTAAGTTLYLPQDLHTRAAPKLPTTAVFLPNGFAPTDGHVDLVLYLHGKKSPCGGSEHETIREMLASSHFRGLRPALAASFKNAALVAPTLGFRGEVGPQKGFGRGEPWQLLQKAARAIADEHGKGELAIRHVVLAGHSMAGTYMLQMLDSRADQLAGVIAIWGLDCTYDGSKRWRESVAANPAITFTFARSNGGSARDQAIDIEEKNRSKNARFFDTGVRHCATPVQALPKLLADEPRLELTPIAARLVAARFGNPIF